MRVIIQMGDSYPTGSPCANRVRTFYDEFKAQGDSVKILAPKTKKHRNNTDDVVYCPNVRIKSKSAVNRFLNQMSLGFSSLICSFKIGKADVVITTSPPPLINFFGFLIAKFKRAKLVYDVRDIWPDVAWEMGSLKKNGFLSNSFAFIRNFMLKHSDLVTAVSEGKKVKLHKYYPHANIVIISNGLDTDFLNSPENTELISTYSLKNQFTCVYVGNLGLAQGLMQLLEIAKRAQKEGINAQFLLFGSGVEMNRLEEFVISNGLKNVIFAGRIPSSDIYTVLKYSDMSFVSLVNKNLTDSIPTKLYESLAVGCPVLLAASGESADLLNTCKLGIAVEPNNPEKLWDAFLNFYNNIGQFEEYKTTSRQVIVSEYSRQEIAKKMKNELDSLFQD